MSDKIYGVLKSKVQIDEGEYTSDKTHLTHYNLITIENDDQYQVNIDIQSNQNTPNVRVLCIDDYRNDLVNHFDDLALGFTPLSSTKGGLSLDYLRENLFPREDLFTAKPLSGDEITKILNKYLECHENVIVFGTKYGPENNLQNHYGTLRSLRLNRPSTGVDGVHMNQGSIGRHARRNGIYQDGALFVQNSDKTYSAFFFSFTEQCSNTDENGNCLWRKIALCLNKVWQIRVKLRCVCKRFLACCRF